jgi:hypothetical protein
MPCCNPPPSPPCRPPSPLPTFHIRRTRTRTDLIRTAAFPPSAHLHIHIRSGRGGGRRRVFAVHPRGVVHHRTHARGDGRRGHLNAHAHTHTIWLAWAHAHSVGAGSAAYRHDLFERVERKRAPEGSTVEGISSNGFDFVDSCLRSLIARHTSAFFLSIVYLQKQT